MDASNTMIHRALIGAKEVTHDNVYKIRQGKQLLEPTVRNLTPFHRKTGLLSYKSLLCQVFRLFIVTNMYYTFDTKDSGVVTAAVNKKNYIYSWNSSTKNEVSWLKTL